MSKGDKLRFGLAIPQWFPADDVDPSLISDFLGKAESLGYDSAWTMDSTSDSSRPLDSIAILSYAAAFTSRIKLGTLVMMPIVDVPVLLANRLATLDQLSKGRLIWGVGLGTVENFASYGLSPERKVSRFEEGLQLIRKLWTEDDVSFHGRFWQMDNFKLTTRPFQKPHPPIWFGGFTPPALKRAVRLGDGWMGAGYAPIQTFKEQMQLIRQYLEEEGRDPTAFPLSKRVNIAVDRDKKRASAAILRYFDRMYGNGLVYRDTGVPSRGLEASVFGSPEECIEGLAEIASEGLDLIVLTPVSDIMEQMERLARDVIPKLQS